MKHESGFRPPGLLPLLLLRQEHTRDLAFRTLKPMLDSVGSLDPKLPVARFRGHRLIVGVWRTSSWKKTVKVLARPQL